MADSQSTYKTTGSSENFGLKRALGRIVLVPAIAMGIVASSCEKENLSPIPSIEILRTGPLFIEEFSGVVEVELRYEDGDGDLGFIHPDSLALEVWDDRLERPDGYYVPPLAPVESSVPIRGVLVVKLGGIFILGNGTSETTTYTLRIRDRKGNWSNTVETLPITIEAP